MGVTGLFEKEKNVGASSALLNLIVSLALVKPYGMAGVLLGTLLSYLLQILYRYIIYFRDFLEMPGEALRYAQDIRSRRYASVLRLLSPVYCDSAAAGSGDLWKRLETSEHCNHGEGNAKSLMQ